MIKRYLLAIFAVNLELPKELFIDILRKIKNVKMDHGTEFIVNDLYNTYNHTNA